MPIVVIHSSFDSLSIGKVRHPPKNTYLKYSESNFMTVGWPSKVFMILKTKGEAKEIFTQIEIKTYKLIKTHKVAEEGGEGERPRPVPTLIGAPYALLS